MSEIVIVFVESVDQPVDSPDAEFDPLSELSNVQVEIWNGVDAVLVAPGIYRLVGEISEGERLRLKTGDVVRCEERPPFGLTAIELFT